MKILKLKISNIVTVILLIELLSVIALPSALKVENFPLPETDGSSFIQGYVYLEDFLLTDVDVELYNFLGVLVDTFYTPDGFYHFVGLDPGFYRVKVPYSLGYCSSENCTYLENDGDGVELNIRLIEDLNLPGNCRVTGDVYFEYPIAFPARGAKVSIFDDTHKYLGCTFVDETATFTYDGLWVGSYDIEIERLDFYDFEPEPFIYEIDTSNATFSSDGDEHWDYYILMLIDTAFIDVYVYDDISLNPIVGANVSLYTAIWQFLDSGVTDIDGFYNFTSLEVDDYIIEVSAAGYQSQYKLSFIDYYGEAEYSHFYLSVIPPRSILITNPINSQIVPGGRTYVEFSASDEVDLDYIDVYVNDEQIFSFYYTGFNNDLLVPIFQNGTNTILLDAYWTDDSSANDSVTINSVDVIPVIDLHEGDFIHMRTESIGYSDKSDLNYTFHEWLTPFEINTSVILHSYDEFGTIYYIETWHALNVLNGFIPYDGGQDIGWLNTSFIGFSCLPCPETTGTYPSIGDKSVFISWDNVFTIIGEQIWKYTEVWTMTNAEGYVMYAEKSSQLLYYYEDIGYMDLQIIYTNLDYQNPIIVPHADLIYSGGSGYFDVYWIATDMNPEYYEFYIDDVLSGTGSWTSVNAIQITVGGFSVGTYDLKIIVFDAAGNSAMDTISAIIEPIVSEIGKLHFIVFWTSLILIATVAFSYRYKMKKR